jgi:hypothetical protein
MELYNKLSINLHYNELTYEQYFSNFNRLASNIKKYFKIY